MLPGGFTLRSAQAALLLFLGLVVNFDWSVLVVAIIMALAVALLGERGVPTSIAIYLFLF